MLLDDKYDLPAWVKFLVQVGCSAAVVFMGVKIGVVTLWAAGMRFPRLVVDRHICFVAGTSLKCYKPYRRVKWSFFWISAIVLIFASIITFKKGIFTVA